MPDEPQPAADEHGNPPPYFLQEGEPPDDPPFVGPLAYAAQMMILDTGDGWRAQRVKLDHAIVILQASGPGLPDNMALSGVCAGAEGTAGAQMEVADLLNALVDTIALTCKQTELRDPFVELDALKEALLAFIKEVADAKKKTEPDTFWQRIRWRFPSRKREEALIGAFNRYMKVVTHIQQHGYADTPDEDVSGMEGLTREDFGK